jgi:hypothetical protein
VAGQSASDSLTSQPTNSPLISFLLVITHLTTLPPYHPTTLDIPGPSHLPSTHSPTDQLTSITHPRKWRGPYCGLYQGKGRNQHQRHVSWVIRELYWDRQIGADWWVLFLTVYRIPGSAQVTLLRVDCARGFPAVARIATTVAAICCSRIVMFPTLFACQWYENALILLDRRHTCLPDETELCLLLVC